MLPLAPSCCSSLQGQSHERRCSIALLHCFHHCCCPRCRCTIRGTIAVPLLPMLPLSCAHEGAAKATRAQLESARALPESARALPESARVLPKSARMQPKLRFSIALRHCCHHCRCPTAAVPLPLPLMSRIPSCHCRRSILSAAAAAAAQATRAQP
jgi:hypothetical protein